MGVFFKELSEFGDFDKAAAVLVYFFEVLSEHFPFLLGYLFEGEIAVDQRGEIVFRSVRSKAVPYIFLYLL